MHSRRNASLLLWIAATDSTFARVELRDGPALVGKCIHCGSKHTLSMDGTPRSSATLEHIVPRCHGGTNALDNVAIACSRCNSGKGVRHDNKARLDEKLQAVIAQLSERRRARWREPPAWLSLPPLPAPQPETPDEDAEAGAEDPGRRGRRRRG